MSSCPGTLPTTFELMWALGMQLPAEPGPHMYGQPAHHLAMCQAAVSSVQSFQNSAGALWHHLTQKKESSFPARKPARHRSCCLPAELCEQETITQLVSGISLLCKALQPQIGSKALQHFKYHLIVIFCLISYFLSISVHAQISSGLPKKQHAHSNSNNSRFLGLYVKNMGSYSDWHE